MFEKKIAVIGLGYIGLPTAAILASCKFEVAGVDISERVVDVVNSGNIHIVEPHLEKLVSTAVRTGFLTAALQPDISDIYIIAVPTPLLREGPSPKPDLSYVMKAFEAIAPLLKADDLIAGLPDLPNVFNAEWLDIIFYS